MFGADPTVPAPSTSGVPDFSSFMSSAGISATSGPTEATTVGTSQVVLSKGGRYLGSTFVPQMKVGSATQAKAMWATFDTADKSRITDAWSQFGKGAGYKTPKSFWEAIVDSVKGTTTAPWEAVTNLWSSPGYGAVDPSGASTAYTGPTHHVDTQKAYDLTNPTDAKAMLSQVLPAILGRQVTDADVEQFLAPMHATENANPTVQSTVADTGGGADPMNQQSSQSSTQTGGVNPQQIATDWARSQPGAGEYFAAVPLLQAFDQAIKSPV